MLVNHLKIYVKKKTPIFLLFVSNVMALVNWLFLSLSIWFLNETFAENYTLVWKCETLLGIISCTVSSKHAGSKMTCFWSGIWWCWVEKLHIFAGLYATSFMDLAFSLECKVAQSSMRLFLKFLRIQILLEYIHNHHVKYGSINLYLRSNYGI